VSQPVISVGPATICAGQGATLTASGANTYIWSPAATLSSSTGSSVTSAPLSTTTYTVTGDLNGCTASAQVTVTVNPLPVLSVASNISLCIGDSATIVASGANTYTWSPATALSATTGSTVISYTSSQITYTVTGDINGCTASSQVTISINPLPVVNFTPNPTEGCSPLHVQFMDASTALPGSTYFWNFGDNSTSTLQNPSHTFIQTGTFIITLTITTPDGCVHSLSQPAVTVYPNPVASFTVNPQAGTVATDFSFYDQSYTNIVSWNWTFGDGTGASTVQHPTYKYDHPGNYEVVLAVSNTWGCVDTAKMMLTVEAGEFEIWIPNVFTPNGDNINETFNASGIGICKYEMSIFDRWGEEIYHSKELDAGWNGRKFNILEEVQIDVYVYLITAWDCEGEAHEYIGRVTVLR
jgi:gliding motility-associated-like protein